MIWKLKLNQLQIKHLQTFESSLSFNIPNVLSTTKQTWYRKTNHLLRMKPHGLSWKSSMPLNKFITSNWTSSWHSQWGMLWAKHVNKLISVCTASVTTTRSLRTSVGNLRSMLQIILLIGSLSRTGHPRAPHDDQSMKSLSSGNQEKLKSVK